MTLKTRAPGLRILLATDDSASALSAEAWSAALRPAGPRLVDVVTVAGEPSAWTWQAQTYRPAVRAAVDDLQAARIHQAERVANAVGERLQADPDVTIRTWGRTGDTVKQVLAVMAETAPDVVVVGHRGRSALAELVLGSVARSLLAESPCPVLVAGDAPGPGPAPARAVLLTDEAPGSTRAVAAIARTGFLRGADVVVLQAPSPPGPSPSSVPPEEHAAALRAAGSRVSTRVEPGDAVEVAIAVVDQEAADLVVVPRTSPPHSGATEARLVCEARKSVLAVPVI